MRIQEVSSKISNPLKSQGCTRPRIPAQRMTGKIEQEFPQHIVFNRHITLKDERNCFDKWSRAFFEKMRELLMNGGIVKEKK